MRTKVLISGLLFAVLCFSSLIYSDVPEMINYQGKITTSTGALIDTTVQMIFTIYDAAADGEVLWADTQSAVVVEKGVFSVLLGSGNPIPDSVFSGDVRYLGVKVGDDLEMSPRKEIVSVAYAYKALEADTAEYAHAAPATGADQDWLFRITDTADTTLVTGGAWGISRAGNVLYGYHDSTHVNLGVACTTGTNGQNKKYSTVGGGAFNRASGYSATVGGGEMNTASGQYSTVGGGDVNTASGWSASVGGGEANIASGNDATIGGGEHNTASKWDATVGGGNVNTASGQYSTVGGGWVNIASGYAATIPGGQGGTVDGDCSFAAGSYVKIDTLADYTFAFGNNFATSTSHAVIFYDASSEMKVGIQETSPTARLDVNSSTGYSQIRMRTSYTPTGTSDTNGNVGDIAWDDSYLYIKTSGGWKRAALTTW